MNGSPEDRKAILAAARADGWVLEPEAKRLFASAGFDLPRGRLCRTAEEAVAFAAEIGYPVAAKVVSPQILHKSDVGGVAVGIAAAGELEAACRRFAQLEGFRGTYVEAMAAGVELILGAKIDLQFGPMILLGMGGVGVEIYRDVVLRMAPLAAADVPAMVAGLKARRLLEGYRGAAGVAPERLRETVLAFSALVMELAEGIESIDVNPLLCSPQRCVVADARIILRKAGDPAAATPQG